MRTDTDTGRRGYDHAAAYYTSDEDLMAVALPFLLGGLEAGEPTVVSLAPERSELVRRALPRSAEAVFTVTDDLYARPAAAIKSYREMMAGFVADGARGIRILGEIPPVGLSRSWDWWARYESAVNHAYDEFPLRSMCAYDTRTTPRHVLDDVAATHPFVAAPDGAHLIGERYVEPPDFLADPRPMTPYPIERTPPLVELTDPAPAAARRAVVQANRASLSAQEIGNLVLAVSEIVTNAARHGRPPVLFRVWSDTDHVVVTIHDTGAGPTDPFAGLLPAPDRESGGLGLWLTHQICHHVALHRDKHGFTVRLTAGDPHHTAPHLHTTS
ncbi:sensor histidine kinase [Saccharothrix sp. S26]|uniref:sensor histidine kinase n=1 Tax=Saccharothrix sp. S26 TaxID=2907215 RepID=UPI001F30E1BA|nr:sensor histidine kinase [Saccharothrix sp. S26]MCE6995536.1 sensor histidine kinase [Saccharothrix sp. S26]